MTRLYEDHADLYDLAFDWDVSTDVAWLHARLGSDCRSVLEPGWGSGRIVATLAGLGIEVIGLDRSPQMVAAAPRRLEASGAQAEVILADMTDFHLGRSLDGAVCPINTLAHLSPAISHGTSIEWRIISGRAPATSSSSISTGGRVPPPTFGCPDGSPLGATPRSGSPRSAVVARADARRRRSDDALTRRVLARQVQGQSVNRRLRQSAPWTRRRSATASRSTSAGTS